MVNTRTKPFSLPESMQDYLTAHNTPPSQYHRSLIELADQMTQGGMRLGVEAGTFLTVLTHVMRPRLVVEVGTFIGYSSLCIAGALEAGARMVCCDVSEEWTTVARRHWEAAGLDDRIELVLGPADHTLAALPLDPPIDLAFIDADKSNYITYYEQILERLSPRGMIAVDNTMWSARVLDDDDQSADTRAIRSFNRHVADDDRVTNVTVPIGDGVTLITHAAGLR